MTRPNVLILLPHDLGDMLGCYGHRTVRTPRLDGLAEQGVRLSQYFCVAPECTPSRGSMFTGLHCHQNGLVGLSNFGWELRPGVQHLARRMTDAGYATHLIGLHHETARGPESLGYTHVDGEQRDVQTVCRKVAEFVGRPDSSRAGPWFVCAGFFNVHRPWKPATRFRAEDMDLPPWLTDTPATRQDMADFHDDILTMDEAIGGVLDALERSGQTENTLVIFTSDHGLPFPGAKASLYDPGLRIPLILRWPAGLAGGRTPAPLVSNVDFTPSVLDLCGIAIPNGLAGRTFAPLLRGHRYAEREAVFASLAFDVAYDPMHVVRTKTQKYIRSFAVTPAQRAAADPTVLAVHAGGRLIRVDDYDVLSSAAWRSRPGEPAVPPEEELYDLVNDPWEQHNLAMQDTARPALLEMRRRLEQWMEETESPLRHGHIPANDKQREAFARYRPGGPMYDRFR